MYNTVQLKAFQAFEFLCVFLMGICVECDSPEEIESLYAEYSSEGNIRLARCVRDNIKLVYSNSADHTHIGKMSSCC